MTQYRTFIEKPGGNIEVLYQGESYTDALLSYPSFIKEGQEFFFERNGEKKQVVIHVLRNPVTTEN